MTLASSAGVSRAVASRRRISSFQSGMLDSRHVGDRAGELDPALAVCLELSLPVRSQPVEPPPPLAGLLDPSAFDEPLPLEPVEERVERCGVNAHDALRPLLEQLAQLIPMPLLGLEQGENEHGCGALLEFVGEHSVSDICVSAIVYWVIGTVNTSRCAAAISHQPSAISHQPSAISHQPSAISHQPSAISHQPYG